MPVVIPDDEDELIVPAREGTLRVLRAAARNGVKRTVLTSSIVSMMEGHDDYSRPLTEADWSNPDRDIGAYPKSKTLAERAAWAFMESDENESDMELVVINPGLVLGPILDPERVGASMRMVEQMLSGGYPGSPKVYFNLVDVRDVASAHVAAMTASDAPGNRYVCISDSMWMQDIARTLADFFGPDGYKVPTRGIPGIAVRLFALVDKQVKQVIPNLGRQIEFDNSKIKRDLNWDPRSVQVMLKDSGDSLIAHELV